MKSLGIISYNIYGNFSNYGSALQYWVLHQAIKRIGDYHPVLVDYCPDVLMDKDPLNPFKNMWDQDEESRKMCEMTMPAIRVNYEKFEKFYTDKFYRTPKKYTSANYNDVVEDEKLDGFVCGSDTIFCMDEFGFDDGFYANYPCMQGKSIAYAASFGDPTLNEENCRILNERLLNFKAFGLREEQMIQYVKDHTSVPVQRVLDPTLLLTSEDYDILAAPIQEKEKYLLLYSRRYSPIMEAYAERIAQERGLKIIEISLRATNAEKGHIMRYDAGVEEFLSLVKHADYVVTNSFHGMIFSVQYRRHFVIFSREQCNNKIAEILDLFGLSGRMLITGNESFNEEINYNGVHKRINDARINSITFLKEELDVYLI